MKRTGTWHNLVRTPPFSLRNAISGADTPETPQACNERAALVRDLRARLREQARRLPWLLLQGTERSALGGAHFQGAPVFVATLCKTILAHPARYPDLQERARFLLSRHDEAEGWSGLREELGSLYELAGDHMLAAREESVSGAIAIMQKLEGAASLEEWGGSAWERLLGVMAARVVLEAHRQATARSQERPARTKSEDTEARRHRRQRWEAQLLQGFQRLLARRG